MTDSLTDLSPISETGEPAAVVTGPAVVAAGAPAHSAAASLDPIEIGRAHV